jgi:voltage-gated potassium channel
VRSHCLALLLTARSQGVVGVAGWFWLASGARRDRPGDGSLDLWGHVRRRKSRARANSTVMSDQSRLERRLDRVLARATTPRGAGLVIASATTAVTLAAAILMTVVDRDSFPTVGSALWWAVQTVTTVGYGDDVPTTVAGQLLAALVMLFGIGFLTVITAAITSTFVSRARAERGNTPGETSTEQFREIQERLDRIEAALTTNR